MTVLLVFVLFKCLYTSYAIDCYDCANKTDPSNCHSVKYCPNSTFCFIESNGSGINKTYTMGCDTTSRCVTTTLPPPTPSHVSNHMTGNMTTTGPLIITTTATMNTSITSMSSTTPSATFVNSTTAVTAHVGNTTLDHSNVTNSTSTTSPMDTNKTGSPPLIGRRDWLYSEELNMYDENVVNLDCCTTDTCNKHLLETTAIPIVTPTLPENGCYDEQGKQECEHFNELFNVCDNIQKAKKVCKKTCNLCELDDGNWSEWSNWTSCDVTCGNGTRMRDRTCDNPEPKAGGDNCTGDGMETEACTERNCPIDGNWAAWASWSDCSVTCGIGLQKRIRNCSDPFPEADGLFCLGASSDEKICMKEACNDTWLDWSSWSECSVTCGTGMKTRRRQCNSAMRLCFGDVHDSALCEVKDCQGPVSAFLTNGVAVDGPENDTIYFTTVITNVGDDYNSSTGQFTCRIPGIYSFHVSIEKQLDVNQAYCHLMKNGNTTIFVGSRAAFIHGEQYQQASNTAVLELSVGDSIYLGMCSEPKTFTEKSTFSGTLIVAEEDSNI